MEGGVTFFLPHIPVRCSEKLLPVYTSALDRSGEDFLSPDDLDKIQLELEKLLSKVSLRYRLQKSEHDFLNKDDRFSQIRIEHDGKKPLSPGKRKREDMKKCKAFSVNVKKSNDDFQHDTHSLNFVYQKEHRFLLQKNDITTKFWLSVEPYCMSISNEDLRVVDDFLNQYCGAIVPPIPSLGEHYSTLKARYFLNEVKYDPQTPLQKKINLALPTSGKYITGPFSHRLVSSLIENQNLSNVRLSDFAINKQSRSVQGLIIEQNLKKELISQGILDKDLSLNKDEVLCEIEKLISEVSSVSEYNLSILKQVREKSIGEIGRQQLKRDMDSIDHEILMLYRKIASEPNLKDLNIEKQQCVLRLALEQKVLSDKLDKSSVIKNFSTI